MDEKNNVTDTTAACSPDAIINAQKLNLIAISVAGALATKLTDNQRATLSLFFATVSTALANIAFVDGIYDQNATRSAQTPLNSIQNDAMSIPFTPSESNSFGNISFF